MKYILSMQSMVNTFFKILSSSLETKQTIILKIRTRQNILFIEMMHFETNIETSLKNF